MFLDDPGIHVLFHVLTNQFHKSNKNLRPVQSDLIDRHRNINTRYLRNAVYFSSHGFRGC